MDVISDKFKITASSSPKEAAGKRQSDVAQLVKCQTSNQ